MPKRKKISKFSELASVGSSVKKSKNVNSAKSCRRIIRALKNYNRENDCNLLSLINSARQSPSSLKVDNSSDKTLTIHPNFDQIINKVNTNEYSSVEQLCEDIESIITDAKAIYNEQNKEYQDAIKLYEFFLDLKKDFCSQENTADNNSLNTRVMDKSDDEINIVGVINRFSESINSNTDDIGVLISKNNVSKFSDDTIIVLSEEEEDELNVSPFVTARSDDPWTVKYKPLNLNQVLGNKQASNNIKDWIHDFMAKSPTDSRLEYYYDDDDDYEYDDRLESCALIYGPTGCGKTAMVYALAEELNYKVIEINCSSRRNGKIINQIKETTLSHTVTRNSNSPFKNPPSKSNSNSPFKNPAPQSTKSNTKKSSIDPKQKSLLSFFQKTTKSTAVQKLFTSSIDDSSMSQETVNNLNSLTISSNSLILFDDVDIIFDEDTGFWQALSQLIQNTKRSILLTATNSIESIKQEVKNPLCIEMNYPTLTELVIYLKEIVFQECYISAGLMVKEDHDYDNVPVIDEHVKRIELISKDNHCDIRSSVNRLL